MNAEELIKIIDGTYDEDFLKVFKRIARKHKLLFKIHDNIAANPLLKFLENPYNSALVSHHDSLKDPHWSFWHSSKDKGVAVDNIEFLSPLNFISKKNITNYLSHTPKKDRKIILINAGNYCENHKLIRVPAETSRYVGNKLFF